MNKLIIKSGEPKEESNIELWLESLSDGSVILKSSRNKGFGYVLLKLTPNGEIYLYSGIDSSSGWLLDGGRIRLKNL